MHLPRNHCNIIFDCLRDGRISIRRRALELSYALIDEGNIRILTQELLVFVEVAVDEFKVGMTTQLDWLSNDLRRIRIGTVKPVRTCFSHCFCLRPGTDNVENWLATLFKGKFYQQ